MTSWLSIDENSDFSLGNLPYGIFSTESKDRRASVAIGDYVLDIRLLAERNVFSELDFDTTTLMEETLNRYAGLGQSLHRQVRAFLQDILREDTPCATVLKDNDPLREEALVPLSEVTMHLPMDIKNYTDFFTSPYHAKNCTDILRPGQPVSRAFFKFPLGYNGRASSIVVSGTSIDRPRGQYFEDDEAVFGPCQRLDYEVEFAAFVGRGTERGASIDIDNAEDHIFGVCLMNDWSARDIQTAESVPLGPFNGKNFCTTISPWIVPLEALQECRASPIKPGNLLPYLDEGDNESGFDIPINVYIQAGSETFAATTCNANNTSFSLAQMLVHQSSGGCPMRPGDMFATGTLSGANDGELGCLLEANRGGIRAVEMKGTDFASQSIHRTWLEDGDTVKFAARVKDKNGPGYIGFGECQGTIIGT